MSARQDRALALLATCAQRLLTDERRPDSLLGEIFVELGDLLGMEIHLQYRVAEDGTWLALERAVGLDAAERAALASMRVGDLVCGQVAQDRVALIVEDVPSSTRPGCERLAAFGALSYAGFPLVAGDRLLGTLAFFSRRRARLDPGDTGLIGTVCDQIAAYLDRRRLVEELQASNAALRSAVQRHELAAAALPGLVYDWDVPGRTVWRAGQLPGRLGIASGEVPTAVDWWRQQIHPDDVARATATFEDAVATGADRFECQYRVMRRGDQAVWVWEHGVLVRGAGGRVERVVGTTIDIDAQRQAEEAVRDGARRLQMALDASYAVVFDWDILRDEVRRPFSNLDVLPAIAATATPGRFGDVLQVVHPEDRGRFRAAIDAALAAPAAGFRSEHRIVTPDGGIRWLREVAQVECDDQGRPVRMTGLSQDVTAQVEATLRLRASEARHAFLLGLGDRLRPLSDPMAIQREACRALGEALHASRVGYAEDTGDGDTVRLVTHHAVGVPPLEGRWRLADFGPRLAAAFRSGRTVVLGDASAAGAADDRAERDALAAMSIGAMVDVPLVKDGRLAAVLFVHQATPRTWSRDEVDLVTETAERLWSSVERARAESRLADERSVLDAVLATAPVGFALFDRDLRFRMINERLAGINGVSVADHLGRTAGEIVPSLEAQARSVVDRVFATGQPLLDHEFSGETPAAPGQLRHWRESWYPVRTAGGAIGSVAVMVEEITEGKRLEREREALIEALRTADRRKDEFLAMLAHELRNPLAPIRHAVEVMRLPGVDAALSARMRDTIGRQVDHLSRLVDDLLDASRVTQGKIALDRRVVDLAVVAFTGVELTRPLIDARGHRLSLVLPPPGEVWVDADPARLAQVLGNLLANAAKYTDRGGRITLTVATEQDDAVLSVEDDGVGITREMLPAVFDLFTQADRSLDRAQGGLGIGLALVRSLVGMHGGTVSAHSEGPGRGSRFTVRLPRVAPPAPSEPVGFQPVDCAGRRVLVVDDNADAADSLALLLQFGGCPVEVAHDGASALAVAQRFAPEVCLVDIGLPDMDGYAVARRLRELVPTATARLVAITGYGRDEDRDRALAAGFDEHLTKPVEPARLYAAVGAAPADAEPDRPSPAPRPTSTG